MDQRVNVLPAAAPVTVEAYALDRLIKAGDGDCALLYLYILRNGGRISVREAADALGMAPGKVSDVMDRLYRMKLVVWPDGAAPSGPAPVTVSDAAPKGVPGPAPAPVLEPEGPPEYSAEDIAAEMEGDSPFPGLVTETQRRLGRVLSSADLKILFGLYDYLDLPAEVISMLVTYCAQEAARTPGGGRPLRMRQVEKEAYRWKRLGVDNLDRAVEHLKKLDTRREESSEILHTMQIYDRAPAPSERKYIEEWLEMGFPTEAVALAYDKTVLQTGDLKWPYLNSILKRWHQKNLHTLKEIEAGDAPQSQKSRNVPASSSGGSRDLETIAWMKELVRRQGQEE